MLWVRLTPPHVSSLEQLNGVCERPMIDAIAAHCDGCSDPPIKSSLSETFAIAIPVATNLLTDARGDCRFPRASRHFTASMHTIVSGSQLPSRAASAPPIH